MTQVRTGDEGDFDRGGIPHAKLDLPGGPYLVTSRQWVLQWLADWAHGADYRADGRACVCGWTVPDGLGPRAFLPAHIVEARAAWVAERGGA